MKRCRYDVGGDEGKTEASFVQRQLHRVCVCVLTKKSEYGGQKVIEITSGCSRRVDSGSPVLLNQQCCSHRAVEVMLKDVYGSAV